jgi:Flp pilus assembly protein TadB
VRLHGLLPGEVTNRPMVRPGLRPWSLVVAGSLAGVDHRPRTESVVRRQVSALDLQVGSRAYRRLVGDAKRMDAKTGAGVVGVSAVACAACCAGPILGFLAAVGVTAAVGAVLFGVLGVVLVLVAAVVWRRRRQARRCRPVPAEPVVVEVPRLRSPS